MKNILFGAAACLALAAFVAPAAARRAHPDDGLFTLYSAAEDGTSIHFRVCGDLAQVKEECYAGRNLFPFDSACAVLESSPVYKDNIVHRDIYVLDRRASAGDPVRLYVYQRTDTISDTHDRVEVALLEEVPLPTAGGPRARCSMAANERFVYAGTDVSTAAVSIDKKDFAVAVLPGFDPPATVTSITADDRGYIALHYKKGFYVFSPHGALKEPGGHAADMVNTRNGWRPD